MVNAVACASFAAFWSGLDPLDRWLAALRGTVLLGGTAWLIVHVPDHPADTHAHHWVAGLFVVFAIYSLCLYSVNALRPGRLALLYRAAMVLDLAFIVALVRLTGGMASDFYLAFYLLIALHAFYFGLTTGGAVALIATFLYPFADAWPPPIHRSDLALRLAFFLLVGLSMGGLAERERRERRLVEQLNRQLQDQQQHLKATQEQLIRSDRLATVGELAASLAHEIRNPLAGISGALHVLSEELPRGGPQQSLLAEVQTEITRMNKTLTDLLWHARPPALQYLPLDVNGVVEQSLWFLPMGSQSGILVVKALAPDLPALNLDPNLLHQAFLNILINARQAMPQGGELTVRTRFREIAGGASVVEVEIADTGIGIPPEHLPHVFKPFFTTKAQGTGLGLAIAARIVEQHGGRIGVESQPGRGATFRVSLPLLTEHPVGRHDHAVQASDR